MATAISFANGKNGFCQVNSNCRSIHLDFPFLHSRLTERNSILANRCRLAYATSGMWEVPFIVIDDFTLPAISRPWRLHLNFSCQVESNGWFSAIKLIARISGPGHERAVARDPKASANGAKAGVHWLDRATQPSCRLASGAPGIFASA